MNISKTIISLTKRFISKISRMYFTSNSKRYINHLRKRGVSVGSNCIFHPKSTSIDMTRPSLITIGSNCYMNDNFTLLTHDWVSHVFIYSGRDFVNSSGKVTIGDNVSFGINVTILKGVVIGDNVFIGAGSIVTKDIPSNCVAVGVPCKPIMSLDEYYEKRKKASLNEAKEYALSIKERYGRNPVVDDFWEEFPLFCSGSDVEKYPSLPIKAQLGPSYSRFVSSHKALYDSFDAFIESLDSD